MEIVDYLDAMRKAEKEYTRYLEPVCKSRSLTQNELAILLFLYNNPGRDRAADIVNCRGIAKSHVSLAVGALGKRKLLVRSFDPEDRRTVHLTLTEQGRTIAGEGKAAQQRFFSILYRGITPEEFEYLNEINRKIYGNIQNLKRNEESVNFERNG